MLKRLNADEAIAALTRFDAVVDARSESEFALDHLPGAVNWPTLNDDERRIVGTEYKQVSAFEARKRGAAMAARNIANHLDREGAGLPKSWKPLVYCWRGGQRSGALALILSQVGFEVTVLEGGYRTFRRVVIDALEALPARFDWRVLCGRTGSGKSRLLGALSNAGAQVLDLEALASHRGSVLGPVPGEPQPSQKRFETLLWKRLRAFDPARPVFIESESRTVGRLRVPEALLERMRDARCLNIEMPLSARVALLMEDYAHHVEDPAGLCERLQVLRELRGAAVVEAWQSAAREGRMRELVEQLLEQHYDPGYDKSTAKHFAGFVGGRRVVLADGSAAALKAVAQELVAGA